MKLVLWVSVLAASAAFFPRSVDAAEVRVTTTATMVTDMVRRVGGDRVEVEGLMGPGVDPHLYSARASDAGKLRRADAIFYVGLFLEGKMEGLLERMEAAGKAVFRVSDVLPREKLLEPPEFGGHYDPHIWFEIPLWADCIEAVVKGLSEVDPAGAKGYEERGKALRQEMLDLHEWALKRVEELPRSKRILVTSHDAYNYFGRAYGFDVVGLQGISTADKAGLADMANLVDFIKKHEIKAIFVESSVPRSAIERISQDAGVAIGGELFSDAMGTPGQIEDGYDVGTYEGMIKHNINTIVEALK